MGCVQRSAADEDSGGAVLFLLKAPLLHHHAGRRIQRARGGKGPWHAPWGDKRLPAQLVYITFAFIELAMLTVVMGSATTINIPRWPWRIKTAGIFSFCSVPNLFIPFIILLFKIQIKFKLYDSVWFFIIFLNGRHISIHVSMSALWVKPKGRLIFKRNSNILFLWSCVCKAFVNMNKKKRDPTQISDASKRQSLWHLSSVYVKHL